jgi:hypothetical protein
MHMDGTRSPSRTLTHPRGCRAWVVGLVMLGGFGGLLEADAVYKSVDADGHVVYSDHPDASSSPASLVQIEGTPETPRTLHFCWTNCFTLTLDNGMYTRADGTDETWTIERFTAAAVILHRHDAPATWNGLSRDVIYRGQIANDQLINVTVNGAPVRDIQMAWGDALASLPGSNAERDQRLAQLQQAPLSGTGAAPTGEDTLAATDIDMRAPDAPPPLPDEEPPGSTVDGYAWTPGYWAWGGGTYTWVTGAWIPPPRVGLLWTPGFWEYAGAVYVFHRGYWGPHVGYYGGISAAPTAAERVAATESHVPPTALQRQYLQQAVVTPPATVHTDGAHAAGVRYTPQGSSAPMPAAHAPAPPVMAARIRVEPARAAVASPSGEPQRVPQPARSVTSVARAPTAAIATKSPRMTSARPRAEPKP